MTEEQIIEGFRLSLNQLVPNTVIQWHPAWPEGLVTGLQPESSVGFQHFGDHLGLLWFQYEPGRTLFFTVERIEIGLTDMELRLLRLVPVAIESLQRFGSQQFLGLSLKYSSKIGFGDVLISLFLESQGGDTINNQISIFLVLQDLSFRYYEDKRCSSGFVYTDKPAEFTAQVQRTNFAYTPFDAPLPFNFSLFSAPASFRYVDGRNSYYVIDDRLQLHGIVRLRNPDSYSLVARLRNQHLRPLLADMPGNTWVSFIGLKEEVYVIVSPDLQLKWSRNHWQLRDRSILFSILATFGLAPELHELFVSLLFALSEGGYGAGILIPEDPARLPKAVGKIDHTEIGDHLRNMILRSSIVDLNATNSLLGIVASDGLTTVSRDGLVLSCGDIIDISEAALLQSQGGGRSQAAIAASFFGLSVKISQNGPISFYHAGKLVLQF